MIIRFIDDRKFKINEFADKIKKEHERHLSHTDRASAGAVNSLGKDNGKQDLKSFVMALFDSPHAICNYIATFYRFRDISACDCP